VARERRHWRVWQRYMDPARFVFLDETGASTNMVRRYGRCPRGERLMVVSRSFRTFTHATAAP
jgi:hypothetical protein